MICTYCHRFTPDQGYKCINCGAVIPKKESVVDPERITPLREERQNFFRPWMLAILGLLIVLGYLFVTHQNRSIAINAHNPGAEFTIENYLQKGKTNIVDFYSDYCPPCKKISPLLKKLGMNRADLAVLKIDINRKGVKGIDWFSPLARQYKLQSVPHFQIYDGEGNLVKQGQEAYMEVVMLLASAGISL